MTDTVVEYYICIYTIQACVAWKGDVYVFCFFAWKAALLSQEKRIYIAQICAFGCSIVLVVSKQMWSLVCNRRNIMRDLDVNLLSDALWHQHRYTSVQLDWDWICMYVCLISITIIIAIDFVMLFLNKRQISILAKQWKQHTDKLYNPSMKEKYILPLSKKIKYNYGLRATQSGSYLTKFLVNI